MKFSTFTEMIILRGPPSHSEFRLQKLVDDLSSADLPVNSVYAEYLHVAEASEPLTSEEQSVLEKLLTYGPKLEGHDSEGLLRVVAHARERFLHGRPKRLISPIYVDCRN